MESTRPDHIDNNTTMKHHSQSSELTGSLVASESVPTLKESAPPPAIDFMYEWIRKHSGK